MAIGGANNVGSITLIARVVTEGFEQDLKNKLRGAEGIGQKAGQDISRGLEKGMASGGGSKGGGFDGILAKLEALAPGADKAREKMMALSKAGYIAQGGIGALAGGVSSLVGGLGSLIGVAGGAAASLVAVAGTFAALKAGFAVAKLALSGVGAAASTLANPTGGASRARAEQDAQRALAQTIQRNDESIAAAHKRLEEAQHNLNNAIKDGREQMRQIGFEAEQAALDETGASLNLEKARMTLARVQDMPPSSMARRQAMLQYQEAELAFRRSKANAEVTSAEQNRVAQTGIMGIESVRDATNARSQAELDLNKTLRDALQSQAAAEQALRRAQTSGAQQANTALMKLTVTQKEFAKYLAKMHPEFQALKEAAASGFLPVLQQQLDRLIHGPAFPALKGNIHQLALGMGDATKNFVDIFDTATVRGRMNSFVSTSRTVLSSFGKAAGNAFSGMLGILQAAAPLTQKFAGWLVTISTKFNNFVTKGLQTGSLTKFFDRAGELAGQFGKIFGNVFSGLGGLIKANFGPTSGGQLMLNWLQTATGKWREMNTVAGQSKSQSYFLGAAANTKEMLTTLGGVLSVFKELGTAPETKIFWQTLKQATPFIKTILQESTKTQPALAQLLVSITKFIAALADSGAASTFFRTLSGLVDMVTNVLNALKPVLDVLGIFHGAIVALIFGFKGLQFIFNYFVGQLKSVTRGMNALFGETNRVKVANAEAAKTAKTLQTANVTLEKATFGVQKAEANLAAQRARLLQATNARTQAEDKLALAVNEANIAEAEAMKVNQSGTASDAERAAAADRYTAAVMRETKAEQDLALAIERENVAAQKAAIGQTELAAAEGKVTIAAEKQTIAVAENEAALKTANTAKSGFFSKLTKGAGWAMAAAILVDVLVQVSDALKQARVDAAISGDQIRNSLLVAKNGAKTLRDTLAEVDISVILGTNNAGAVITKLPNDVMGVTASVDDLRLAIGKTAEYSKADWWGKLFTHGSNELDFTIEQMKKLDSQLATIAGSSLPDAQARFREMGKSVGGSRVAMQDQLTLMPEFKAELSKVADAHNIAATNANLLDIALGQGQYQMQISTEKARALATGITDAAGKMISYSDAIDAATKDGKTSLDDFLKAQNKQIQDAAAYQNNLLYLAAHNASEATLKGLEAMDPKVAAQLAQQMVDGGTKTIDKANASFNKAAQYAAGGAATGIEAQATVVQDAFSTVGEKAALALSVGMTSKALTVAEAQKTLVTWKAIYDEGVKQHGKNWAEKLADGIADGTTTVDAAVTKLTKKNPSFKVNVDFDVKNKPAGFNLFNVGTWGSAFQSVVDAFKAKGKKDGGLLKLANGGIAKYVNGSGYAVGRGGPRDDLIPAMISSGEFVVNALSTKKYLPLLNAVNNGSYPDQAIARMAGAQSNGDVNISMTVNPSAGMDERELAAEIGRVLQVQMRRGARS